MRYPYQLDGRVVPGGSVEHLTISTGPAQPFIIRTIGWLCSALISNPCTLAVNGVRVAAFAGDSSGLTVGSGPTNCYIPVHDGDTLTFLAVTSNALEIALFGDYWSPDEDRGSDEG